MYGEVEQGPLQSGWRRLCAGVQEVPDAVHQLVAIVNLNTFCMHKNWNNNYDFGGE